jgi:C-terminal processing protease CtpA/Prc
MVKNFFPVWLMMASCAAFSQTQPWTPEQTSRLAQFSQLYGHIKYFHPFPGYRNINLDSAFAVAAPRLLEAATEADQAAALQQFLDVLGDPATTVVRDPTKTDLAGGTPLDSLQYFFNADSILIVRTNNYYGIDNYVALLEHLEMIKTRARSARGLLLDMRARRPIRSDVQSLWSFCFDYSGLSGLFLKKPAQSSSQRLRMHSGFVPETGGTSGGYYSGFYTKQGAPVLPAPKPVNIPVAVLINAHSEVPPQALPLSQAPNSALFVVGEVSDVSLVEKTAFKFSPTLKVSLRLSEAVDDKGKPGIGRHFNLEETADWDRPEQAALAFLQGKKPAGVREYAGETQDGGLVVPTQYPPELYPSLGYRLLAGAKIWSAIHYFFAYKDLIPGDWDQTLVEFLPQLAAARDSLEYAQTVARMYRHIQDGHGFMASPVLREYFGTATLPVTLRYVEDQAVVTSIWVDSIGQKAGLSVGDVVVSVDGESTDARTRRIGAFLNASNEWTRHHYVARRLIQGRDGGELTLRVLDRSGREKTVKLPLRKNFTPVFDRAKTDTIRILPGNIGYVDLDRLSGEDVGQMFDRLKDTRAIIFDMRGYPNGTAWQIAPRLGDGAEAVAAQFSRYCPTGPDIRSQDQSGMSNRFSFVQHIPPNPGSPVYRGKTVMLIDERTQSQAEHTGLFFEAANGTEFIGSPTAGANGDVTSFRIPGNITLGFSGHDVRHADGRQLQQTGLQPKILVRPSLKGIREGRDEVLDAAVRHLRGE